MTASKILIAAFAVMMVAGTADFASAQQQGQPEGAPAMDHGKMDGGMMGAGGSMMGHQGMMQGVGSKRGETAMCGTMTSHIDGRLAFLKAELKITPEQDSLWNDYAAAVRNNAQAVSSSCTSLMGENGGKTQSLPDRLDAQEKYLTARLDALRATAKALMPLYDGLSETQKQTADQLIRSATGMM